MISFLMPAWKAKYIKEAIESILNQSSDDWELIVVDDCSPDIIREIVNTYKDKRISYYRNEHNIGGTDLVAQWNHCLQYAKGEWVVMAADDDIYHKDFCSEVIRLSSLYPEVNLIRSRVEQIDETGLHLFDDNIFNERVSSYQYLNDWISGRAFTCLGNYAFRRTSLLSIGGFVNFPCGFCSDIATPIILATDGVANTSSQLFKFRQSPEHLSGDKSRLKEKLAATSAFYDWLEYFSYPNPDNPEDAELYHIKNHNYLQKKCLFDYLHQVLLNVTISQMPIYMKLCRRANLFEKALMFARWVKHR